MSSISRATILSIVKGIYFDYNETWYSAFLNVGEMDSFRQKLNTNFKKIEDCIGEVDVLNVISNECVLPVALKYEHTDGTLPATKIKSYRIVPIILTALLIVPI